jgi:hypothetical protein
MRKPKPFKSPQDIASIGMSEIHIVIGSSNISAKRAKKLGKWLLKASEYLKNRKEKRVIGGVII